jgi:methyl-accepting chemotaxis protein
MFARLTLKTKMLVAFLCVGIIPFTAMAVIALHKADTALYDQAFARMQSMRDVKRGQVAHYLQTIKDQALTFSEDQMIVMAMSHFSHAFESFQSENIIGPDDIARLRNQLAGYYQNGFSAAYRQKNDG